jgi:hypothetical protein
MYAIGLIWIAVVDAPYFVSAILCGLILLLAIAQTLFGLPPRRLLGCCFIVFYFYFFVGLVGLARKEALQIRHIHEIEEKMKHQQAIPATTRAT